MKKPLLIAALIFLGSISIQAQNLVTNPGFEDYNYCPSSDGEISLATGWFDPTSTGPDYFNTCADFSSGYSVPSNDCGVLAAYEGNAYAGFFTYFSTGFITNLREYIEIALSSPLSADTTYNVSFHVALSGVSDYAASTIGAYLSASPIYPPQYADGSYTPQVENPSSNVITDTINWTLISGSFTAVGGEQYLTIGNFRTSANSNPVYSDGRGNTGTAYYYIDDVVVTKDMTTGIKVNHGDAQKISVRQDLVSGDIYIFSPVSIKEKMSCMLYDCKGSTIASIAVTGGGQVISAKDIPAGIYIYKVFSDKAELSTGKLPVMR